VPVHQPGQEGGATHQFQRWAPQGRWCAPHWAWTRHGSGSQNSPEEVANTNKLEGDRVGLAGPENRSKHTHTHTQTHTQTHTHTHTHHTHTHTHTHTYTHIHTHTHIHTAADRELKSELTAGAHTHSDIRASERRDETRALHTHTRTRTHTRTHTHTHTHTHPTTHSLFNTTAIWNLDLSCTILTCLQMLKRSVSVSVSGCR